MKKFITTLLVAAAALAVTLIAAPMTANAEAEMAVVYAQIPDSWEAPHVWAWNNDGDHAFSNWPGGAMQEDPNNPGWYFVHIPASMEWVIISADVGDDREQTGDLIIDGLPVWITITGTEAGEVTWTHDQETDGDLPVYVAMAVVFAQIPAEWDAPHVWSWNNDGGHAFNDWPGGAMQEDPNNPGWFYVHIPETMEWVIISADVGDDRDQTGDLIIGGLPVWITITGTEAGEVTWTHDKQTEGDLPPSPGTPPPPPAVDIPDSDSINLYAQVPAGWLDPGVWAWNEGDGYGNVFAGWPGEEFSATSGDWLVMELPDWVDHIIINAISGGVQTANIPVEKGRDIYVAVLSGDGESIYVAYEEFDPDDLGEIEAAPLPELPPEIVLTQPTVDAPASADSGGLSTGVLIAIIAGSTLVAAAIVVFIIKKRKK